MARDVLEALKEEIDLLIELEYYYKEKQKDKEPHLGDSLYIDRLQERKWMLKRIVNRVENNTSYRLGVVEGKVKVIAE